MATKEAKMRMLAGIDVIELSNKFTLNYIAEVFDCSTTYVKNCIIRQEHEQKTNKTETSLFKTSNGAWKELKETTLYKQIMYK